MTTCIDNNEPVGRRPPSAPKQYTPKAPAPDPELEDNHHNELPHKSAAAPKSYEPKAPAPEPELEDNHNNQGHSLSPLRFLPYCF